jgi:hypothetical protein
MAKGDDMTFPGVAFDPNWQGVNAYPPLTLNPFICPHSVVVKYALRLGSWGLDREWGDESCALCGSKIIA